jgi:hypothetical protein
MIIFTNPRSVFQTTPLCPFRSGAALRSLGDEQSLAFLPTVTLNVRCLGMVQKRPRQTHHDCAAILSASKNITPAEAGVLIDDKLHERDIIALIPYWASQGLITSGRNRNHKDAGLDERHRLQVYSAQTAGKLMFLSYEKRLFEGLFYESARSAAVVAPTVLFIEPWGP